MLENHSSVILFIICVFLQKSLCNRRNLSTSIKFADHLMQQGPGMFQNINLFFISHNHSSVWTLKQFVYTWQMNITAEFLTSLHDPELILNHNFQPVAKLKYGIGFYSLYCGKGRKNLVNDTKCIAFLNYFQILQYVQFSS